MSAKYNVLSPYDGPIGLSVALGYEKRDIYRLDGADIDQDSFVTTLLLQKNWQDDALTFATNIKTAFERRKSHKVLEEETSFDIGMAIAFRFALKHSLGLEYRHKQHHRIQVDQELDGILKDPLRFDPINLTIGPRNEYGDYLGPTYHYSEKNWWVTTGILWQFGGGGSQFAFVKNGKNFDEHEKLHIGFSYSYGF